MKTFEINEINEIFFVCQNVNVMIIKSHDPQSKNNFNCDKVNYLTEMSLNKSCQL